MAGKRKDEPVTQAGLWADDTLRSDVWRIGAVFLGVLLAAGLLLSGGDEAEQAQRGGGWLGFGMLAVLIVGVALLVPGRRLPDWAIGLQDEQGPIPLLHTPVVVLGWSLAAVATVAALVVDGPAEAVGAAAIAAVAPLGTAYSLQRFLQRATRTQGWAAARGLRWHPEGELPERTPLLREGEYRYATNVIEGTLADGLEGTICHLACVTVDHHHEGSSERTARFTALVASVPDPGKRLPLCVCAPRSHIPGEDAYEGWRKKLVRIDLESSEFERRFELAIDRKSDEVWLRRLFEPTFVERMTLLPTARLGWELEGGALTVYEAGYVTEPSELERLTELASLVAERVRREVGETTELRRPV